jgi:hypothetical protein
VLAVYTGTSLTSLTAVAANDEDPASALIFNATGGVKYYIAVAGYGTARGQFVLALNQTPGYSPRILSQWVQGKLWLTTSNTTGTTVLEASTNLVPSSHTPLRRDMRQQKVAAALSTVH